MNIMDDGLGNLSSNRMEGCGLADWPPVIPIASWLLHTSQRARGRGTLLRPEVSQLIIASLEHLHPESSRSRIRIILHQDHCISFGERPTAVFVASPPHLRPSARAILTFVSQ